MTASVMRFSRMEVVEKNKESVKSRRTGSAAECSERPVKAAVPPQVLCRFSAIPERLSLTAMSSHRL
jgi:hypothetical protein